MYWRNVGEVKKAGETYDTLLKKMLLAYNRMKLMKKMDEVEQKNEDDLVELDDI